MAGEKQMRTYLLKVGVFVAILCGIAVAISWKDPFPLPADGRGGYRVNRWSELSVDAGFWAGMLTVILAFSGRGAGRLLLAGSGILLLVLAYGALLSHGV
jgi:hypothetical protein